MIRYAQIGKNLVCVSHQYDHLSSDQLIDLFDYDMVYDVNSLNHASLIDMILDAAAAGVSMWRIEQLMSGYQIPDHEILVRASQNGIKVYRQGDIFTAVVGYKGRTVYGYGKKELYSVIGLLQALNNNESSRTFNP